MSLKVIGAGLGRTGTFSLKVALGKLLGGPCYHMSDVLERPEHVWQWLKASHGEMPDWEALFSGYVAAVDSPTCYFWPELMKAYPEALIVLSIRDPQSWFESCRKTLFKVGARSKSGPRVSIEWMAMMRGITKARAPVQGDPTKAANLIRSYEEHNARVRAGVPPERLLIWQAQDGWEPLCEALKLPVPNEPFPHLNTSKEWRRRAFFRRISGIVGKRLASALLRVELPLNLSAEKTKV